jgi:hypothetical protein
VIESSVRRQEPNAAVETPKFVAFEQASPLLWRDLTFGPSSARLNVSLRNDAPNAMPPVAFSFSGSEEVWIVGPKPATLLKNPLSVLPVIAPSAGFLLFQLQSSLFAVILPPT